MAIHAHQHRFKPEFIGMRETRCVRIRMAIGALKIPVVCHIIFSGIDVIERVHAFLHITAQGFTKIAEKFLTMAFKAFLVFFQVSRGHIFILGNSGDALYKHQDQE